MKDLLRMPPQVVRQIGHALGVAQYGGRHPAAKPWKGVGPGVWAPRGAKTARTDVDLIAGRLKAAMASYEARYGKGPE